jgi:serine/threonine protein phosphatase 1
MRTIVIADIHGQFQTFKKLMKKIKFNEEQDRLILLGDYIDRGEESLEVLEYVHFLKQHGAVVLGGNHENMFLNWLDYPNETRRAVHYFQNGGGTTIRSLLGEIEVDAVPQKLIEEKYPKLLEMIRGMDNYYETYEAIYVHAGVDPDKKDFRTTLEEDFRWIREKFWTGGNTTGKHIFFGHTPTGILRRQYGEDMQDFSPFTLSCGTRTAIDGGAAFGEQLNAVILENGDMSWEAVKVKE